MNRERLCCFCFCCRAGAEVLVHVVPVVVLSVNAGARVPFSRKVVVKHGLWDSTQNHSYDSTHHRYLGFPVPDYCQLIHRSHSFQEKLECLL